MVGTHRFAPRCCCQPVVVVNVVTFALGVFYTSYLGAVQVNGFNRFISKLEVLPLTETKRTAQPAVFVFYIYIISIQLTGR